jgi:hypothetical protein
VLSADVDETGVLELLRESFCAGLAQAVGCVAAGAGRDKALDDQQTPAGGKDAASASASLFVRSS